VATGWECNRAQPDINTKLTHCQMLSTAAPLSIDEKNEIYNKGLYQLSPMLSTVTKSTGRQSVIFMTRFHDI
jgi:hypothetical protein